MALETNPLELEIIGAKLTSATEEMGYALQRTGRTIYVKESGDFGTGITTPNGRYSAYPWSIGVSGFVGGECGPAIEAVAQREGLEPGDVIITNHPFLSGALASHLPDLHVLAPYFHDGKIVAFGWAFVHSSDIGGRVPGSISPTNTELYQEGLAIPPLKLMRRGQLNQDLLHLYRSNVRTPGPNIGDVMAMVAALNVGRERVRELAERYGSDGLVAAQEDLIAYAAIKARAALRTIPDGEYHFWDYLDDDVLTPFPVRIRLAMTVADGRVRLDFAGSDPQTRAALNLPKTPRGHTWFPVRLLGLINTLDPTVPLNAGLFESISVDAPRGSLVNPQPPAAVGVRHATGVRVQDVVNGALAAALPEIMTACNGSVAIPIVLAEPPGANGERKVQVVQALVAGQGARAGADGVDGRDSNVSNMSNVPVEAAEAAGSLLVTRYALRPNSGGAGRWRGGTGQIITFTVIRDGCEVAARGTERLRFAPWGLAGGAAGLPGRVMLNLGQLGERELGKIDVLPVSAGDTITIMTPGGGGYGHPFDRPSEAVLADLRRGVVSEEGACRDYGVALRYGSVDEEETRRLRVSRKDMPFYGICSERVAWESLLDDANATRMAKRLYNLPPGIRHAERIRLLSILVPGLTAPGQKITDVVAGVDPPGARQAFSRAVDER